MNRWLHRLCPWFSRKGHRNPSCPVPLCLSSGLPLQEAFLDISSHTPFSFLAFCSPSCVTGFGMGHSPASGPGRPLTPPAGAQETQAAFLSTQPSLARTSGLQHPLPYGWLTPFSAFQESGSCLQEARSCCPGLSRAVAGCGHACAHTCSEMHSPMA